MATSRSSRLTPSLTSHSSIRRSASLGTGTMNSGEGAEMPRGARRERYCSTTWRAEAGRAEADPHRGARVRGEEPALHQALQIDGHVEGRAPDARLEPSDLAQDLARALGTPDEAAPEARVHGHHRIEIGMIAEDGVLARLHHPG